MLGTDVVGMSTAPEVIVVAYSGFENFQEFLCITNYTTGFKEELNHEEVIEVTECVKGDFKGLLKSRFLLNYYYVKRIEEYFSENPL